MVRRRRIEAALSLPERLRVKAAVLGTTVATRIAGEAVSLTFPVPVAGHPGALDAAPDPRGRSLAAVVADAVRYEWGFESSPGQYMVGAMRLSFLGTPTSTRDSADYPEFPVIAHGFFDWFDISYVWLCAWLRLPSRLPDHDRGTSVHLPRADGSLAGMGGTLRMTLIGGAPAATRSQVASAFTLAARGARLPVEHQLLMDARNALWAGDYRRAVIDAGTASEVALASAITVGLQGKRVASEFIEQAIKAANGVVGLLELYISLGYKLPVSKNKVGDRLANKRNDAAHAGREPTDVETRGALEVAQQIVDAARPLPAP